ncbi:Hypothetical protein FSTVST1_4 [Faustovirus ST1]|nr:Hypothetical protein FSTVST1_4 [Faustovirus ST1]
MDLNNGYLNTDNGVFNTGNGVLPVDMYKLLVEYAWGAYRGLVCCNRTLHKQLHNRDWKRKYSFTHVGESPFTPISVLVKVHDVGGVLYSFRMVSNYRISITYPNREVYINIQIFQYHTEIKGITRKFGRKGECAHTEHIDYHNRTITRALHVHCVNKYLPLEKQTSRFKVVLDGAMIKRVLTGDAEWSIQHPFFIF